MELTPFRPDRRQRDRRTPKGLDPLEQTMFRAGPWALHGPKISKAGDACFALLLMGLVGSIALLPITLVGFLVWMASR